MKGFYKRSFIIVSGAILLISAYFIIGVLLYSNNRYNESSYRTLEDSVKILKQFTQPGVFEGNALLRQWVIDIGDLSPHRITLIRANGQVIFDTEADLSLMENHLDREEFQNAVRTGTGIARRQSATLGEYHFYAATAIYDSTGSLAGILRLSLLIPGFYSRLLSSTLPYLIFGFIIILGACAGIFLYSHRLSEKVEEELDEELKNKTRELHRKSEEAETESLHREVILNSMFEGIITLDNKLNIILANPRLCSLFRKDRNVRGMSLLEFCNSAELSEAAVKVLETGQANELTIKRYQAGVQQYFQVFAAPLKDGAVMALRDISRLVKLEQVRKDFVANVSHELRTPIQVIQGFAENILESSKTEEIHHFAEIIAKNARSMDNLSNDLLTLVSLENEDTNRPSPEIMEVLPLISEAVDLLALPAHKKNIKINVNCLADLRAELHSSLFVHALVNLLDNSIKYSSDNSKVDINAYSEEESLIIEVRDRGMGIPSEHLDRIFERFYRVDRSRSREAGGTGLGLSIVRHIALLHHGTVEAESHAGEGSVFKLRYPPPSPVRDEVPLRI
ncbi:MAG: ATP-binding protein [Treponema sp.]|nr:ATP-binding protein [Treponema sp.]